MFQIKSILTSFYQGAFINRDSLITLSIITFIFVFCDFNYLVNNFFQDIYCDDINDDHILDINPCQGTGNRPSSTIAIENSDNS